MAGTFPTDDDPTVAEGGNPSQGRKRLRDYLGGGFGGGVDDDPTVTADDDPTVAMTAPASTEVTSGGNGELAAFSYETFSRRQPSGSHDILLVCAEPLLVLVAHLRNAVTFADIDALRRRVAQEIIRFEERTTRAGAPPGEITAGRYVLCSLIDETVLTTPWGGRSAWSSNSLLNEFHGETWGGEKVFQLLDRVRNEPKKYLGVLCLIDACLSLGFEGRYRVVENGRMKLEDIRAELGRLIKDYLPPVPTELSKDWEGQKRRRTLRNFAPLWLAFSIAAVLLILIYAFVQFRLSANTDPLAQQLSTIESLIR